MIEPIPLPEEIQELLHHPVPSARLAAVREIEKLSNSSHGKFAQSSALALKKLKDDDSRTVSDAAKKVLDNFSSLSGEEIRIPPAKKNIPYKRSLFITLGFISVCCVVLLAIKVVLFIQSNQKGEKSIVIIKKINIEEHLEPLSKMQAEKEKVVRWDELQWQLYEMEEKARQTKAEAEYLSKMQAEAEKEWEQKKILNGILNEQEIKELVSGKIAKGRNIDKNYSWREAQLNNGIAHILKKGDSIDKITRGKWTTMKKGDFYIDIKTSKTKSVLSQQKIELKHDAICWCYFLPGDECNFECKYIQHSIRDDGSSVWYYLYPINENRTGEISEWIDAK